MIGLGITVRVQSYLATEDPFNLCDPSFSDWDGDCITDMTPAKMRGFIIIGVVVVGAIGALLNSRNKR